MILAHTLRRALTLAGPLPADCIAYLHTDPRLPAPTTLTDNIEIAARDDGLFSMRCTWGLHLVGSARALQNSLEKATYGLAISDEAQTPHLNGGIVRLDGTRVLLVAEVGVGLVELMVALLAKGAAYEGVGLVFLRPGGFVAHPAKPRLKLRRLAASGISALDKKSCSRTVYHEEAFCSIDPRIAGVDWSVIEGPIAVVLYVERNDGGRSAIAGLSRDQALARLMRTMRTVGRPDVQAFVRLRASLDKARMFRLSMGAPVAAADIIRAQLPTC